MLFILTISLIPLPFASPTISVCNEALAETTDECLRFAWEEYFVLLAAGGNWSADGE